MSRYPRVAFGEVLSASRNGVVIDPIVEYRTAGIFSFGKGIFARPAILGAETSYKKLVPLRTNQLVFGRLNAWEGGIAVVVSDSDGLFVSQEFPVLDIDQDRVEPSYLAHLCRWPDLWEALMQRSRGLGARSGVRRLRVHEERLLEVEVPLPDIAEQRRVAVKLDAIARRTAAIASRAASLSKLSKALPASLAQRHDLSDHDKQRDGWVKTPLGEIMAEVSDMRTVEPTERYPNVGILSFGRGVFEKPPIDGSTTSAKKLNRIYAGQFIYSRLFAFEGAYSSVPDRFNGHFVSGEFPTFELDQSRLLAPYVAAYLRSEETWADLAGSSKGLGVRRQRIHAETLLAYEIWIPPLTQQRQVVTQLEKLAQATHLRERSVTLAKALDASTLNQAFAGLL